MNQNSQRLKEAIRRLSTDADFNELQNYLIESRSAKLVELEDATSQVQIHKLQGYCQSLRDLIELCSRK